MATILRTNPFIYNRKDISMFEAEQFGVYERMEGRGKEKTMCYIYIYSAPYTHSHNHYPPFIYLLHLWNTHSLSNLWKLHEERLYYYNISNGMPGRSAASVAMAMEKSGEKKGIERKIEMGKRVREWNHNTKMPCIPSIPYTYMYISMYDAHNVHCTLTIYQEGSQRYAIKCFYPK